MKHSCFVGAILATCLVMSIPLISTAAEPLEEEP